MKKVRFKSRPAVIGVIKTFSLSPDDEIGEIAVECTGCTFYYNNLEELCEKWEDYEEPKDYYFIRSESLTVGYLPISNTRSCRNRKEIGNYFDTREEAEQAAEKLKAWTRLKDIGYSFNGWNVKTAGSEGDHLIIDMYIKDCTGCEELLDLLFGGEE